MVELGRVDICTEVLTLSSCLILPREGYLQQLFCMLSYLEKQHNCENVFDHTVPAIDKNITSQSKIGTIQYILMKEASSRKKFQLTYQLPWEMGLICVCMLIQTV